MCELNPTISNLLSGLIGSVFGAGVTVWATRKAISANARQMAEDRQKSDRADYERRLCALNAEVDFNISLKDLGGNKKIPVFASSAWDNMMAHSHQLETEAIQFLTKAYGFALSHNSAARLDDPGKVNYGQQIEQTFDKAVKYFTDAKNKLAENSSEKRA